MSEFERLLKERAQIEQWIDKLAESANKTPENVRNRVLSDYQKRLDEVQVELNGHRDEITAALERHRTVRDGLLEQQSEAEEKRAEAELRHAVGEFDETKWNGIREEIDASLGKIREELTGVDAEVADLEKALASLTPAGDAGTGAGETTGASDRSTIKADQHKPTADESPPPVRVAVPTPAPTKGSAAPSAGTKSGGDLNFLNVDDGQDDGKPLTARAGETVPMPPGAAELLGTPQDAARSGAAPSVGADGVTSFSHSADQPKKGAAKTLKCGECGTMNLPTEWYCERCGAELAAL
jgi:hypothetical protein